VIAIIDNGKQYSDHTIMFVDVGDMDPKQAGRLVACSPFERYAFTIAAAPAFEWYFGKPMPFAELIKDVANSLWGADVSDFDGVDSADLRALLRYMEPGDNRDMVMEALANRGVHT